MYYNPCICACCESEFIYALQTIADTGIPACGDCFDHENLPAYLLDIDQDIEDSVYPSLTDFEAEFDEQAYDEYEAEMQRWNSLSDAERAIESALLSVMPDELPF